MRLTNATRRGFRRLATTMLSTALLLATLALASPFAPSRWMFFFSAFLSAPAIVLLALCHLSLRKHSVEMPEEVRLRRRRLLKGVLVVLIVVGALAAGVVVLPFYLALNAQDPERASIFAEMGGAGAVILTTLGLSSLAVWQTLRGLRAQAELEKERRDFEHGLHEREFVEQKAELALGSDWRVQLEKLILEKGVHAANKPLKPHGLSVRRVSALEPEIKRAVDARERSQARRYIEATDPDAYRELVEQEWREIDAAEEDRWNEAEAAEDYQYEILGLTPRGVSRPSRIGRLRLRLQEMGESWSTWWSGR